MVTTLSKPAENKRAENVRVFLALELPPLLKSSLGEVADHLASHASVLKFVAPDAIHLTVRFLGSIPVARLSAVEQAAREAASRAEPFRLSLDRIGSFPAGGAFPRVIWVGIKRNSGYDSLQHLFASVERELANRGFPADQRALSPHFTLARVKEYPPREDARRLGETLARLAAEIEPCGSFEVKALTVMRSDLAPAGPRYTPLSHVPVGGLA